MLEQLLDFADDTRARLMRRTRPALDFIRQHAAGIRWWPTDDMMRQEPPVLDGLWMQAGTLVNTAFAERQRIAGFHSSAAEHIEGAEYALRRMLGELAAVMPLIGRAEVPDVDVTPLRAVLAAAEAQERAVEAKKSHAAAA